MMIKNMCNGEEEDSIKTMTVSHDIGFEENGLDPIKESQLSSMTFVLFGATGDLAKRKIIPALYNVFLDGQLPHSCSALCLGRREWSDNELQAHVRKAVKTFLQ